MKLFKRIGFMTLALAMFSLPVMASAATADLKVSTSIISGELKFDLSTSSFTFTNPQIDGTIKTIATKVPSITITDATGTGDGWQLLVSANKMKEVAPVGGFKSGSIAKTFDNEAFNIAPQKVTALAGSDITGVAINPVRQSLLNGDVVIASVQKGKGLGKYLVDFDVDALQLQLINKAYVDKLNYPTGGTPYESTLTWKIVVAP